MPTDPHHTSIITQPSSSQPQRKQKTRRPKEKDTQVPQSSVPSDPINVANEAVNEEPSMQLKELMDFYTKLQQRVLDLETGKGWEKQRLQAQDIIISSNEASLGDQEDASKLERKIHDINADEDITLENVHDAEMFNVNDLDGDEAFVKKEVPVKEVNVVEEVVSAAKEIVNAATITEDEKNLLKLQAEEQEELIVDEKAILFQQLLEKRRKHFVAKIAEEKRNRPSIRAQQRSIMYTCLKNMAGWKPKDLKSKSFANIQELFDKAFKRVNTFVDFITELVEGTEMEESSKKEELEQENAKKEKVDDDQEAAKMKKLMKIVPDEEEVTVDAIPLATKPLSIVDWKIVKEGKISYFQIIRADGSSKEGRIVGIKRLLDDLRVTTAKTMFEHHLEVCVWKNQQGLVKVLNWKLYDSCRVHCVTMQNILYYLLVKKMYPLTKHTLHQMFIDVKLQVDYECEMAFELLRLVKK
ncbi:hypothetical protein Tco_1074033 [Tanacetum coccineum]